MSEFEKILGPVLYKAFCANTQFQCLFNKVNDEILEYNTAMEDRMRYQDNLGLNDDIVFIEKSESLIFMTIHGIPCKMKYLVDINKEISIMEMFPAHTKEFTRKSSNLLVNIMDVASDGIWQWYPTNNFGYQSKRFWEILGYDQEKMIESESKWIDYVVPSQRDYVLKGFSDYMVSSGDIPYIEHVIYKHKEGQEIIILCRGSITDRFPDGKPWKLMGTHTDITSIVKKDAVEAQSTFISRMSHEIRSPVCTIINECELLGMEDKTRVIMDTCKQLVSLTDDILSLGEIKKDGLSKKLKLEKTDFYELFTKCVKRHRVECKNKGLSIQNHIGDIPDFILVDVCKFNQIMDNLIDNSLKNTTKGTIILQPKYDYETCVCTIKVIDTGVGISPEKKDTVFDEFVQGNDTMRGAGIGLSLVRRLSKLMGGNAEIESSELGKGTTMVFTCVLHTPENEEEEEEEEEEEKVTIQGLGSSLNILIVDDMESNRKILRRRLDKICEMGLQFTSISEAVNGEEAVNKFIGCKGDFQLVLMDCLMPILDGFDSTVAIHNECERLGIEPVPVVAVTASVSPLIHSKCFETGMKYVVTKPYNEKDLLVSIKSCIQKV